MEYFKKSINIFSYIQASITALESSRSISKIVWNAVVGYNSCPEETEYLLSGSHGMQGMKATLAQINFLEMGQRYR